MCSLIVSVRVRRGVLSNFMKAPVLYKLWLLETQSGILLWVPRILVPF